MVKIEKSSNEFNHFLSRVCISPEHAASFTGLNKLYHTFKNHFQPIMRKRNTKMGRKQSFQLVMQTLHNKF